MDKAIKRFEELDARLLYTNPHDPEWDDVERERTRAITRLHELEKKGL